ncbi:hypothetical protein [Pseudoclavibacter endophyticus]|uniref:Uncharacterized protein n=1 Tax=Pseudoclavibacter endophyticus TaxID=1778590 RepID=A0A6H9WFP0_9MICO|nr:hypothetical protein [Pseudoclavibacter endophyticus]KAB1646948.1 hypothetical protein F8O04_14605 [Pseudoclavibacter endophyticus]
MAPAAAIAVPVIPVAILALGIAAVILFLIGLGYELGRIVQWILTEQISGPWIVWDEANQGPDSTGSTEAPDEVTSVSKHGQEQIEGRDGGVGVSDAAIEDAVSNPIETVYVPATDTWRITGKDAVVVLNPQGRLVTAWATNSRGYR